MKKTFITLLIGIMPIAVSASPESQPPVAPTTDLTINSQGKLSWDTSVIYSPAYNYMFTFTPTAATSDLTVGANFFTVGAQSDATQVNFTAGDVLTLTGGGAGSATLAYVEGDQYAYGYTNFNKTAYLVNLTKYNTLGEDKSSSYVTISTSTQANKVLLYNGSSTANSSLASFDDLYYMEYCKSGVDGNPLGNTHVTGAAFVEQMAYQAAIPEPATATLSLLALAGLAARRRRK